VLFTKSTLKDGLVQYWTITNPEKNRNFVKSPKFPEILTRNFRDIGFHRIPRKGIPGGLA